MKENENMASSSPSKPWSETRNSRIVVLAGIVGLFVVVFWLATKSRRMAAEPAALVVDEQYLSFGEVWEDPAFVWPLQIRNTTNKDIEIADFIANCPCGKIEPRSFKIPALGTQGLRLTLDLRIPRSESDSKKSDSTIEAMGNSALSRSPKPFTIKLIPVFSYGLDPRRGWEIRGRVRVPAELIPPSVSFEYLGKSPPQSLSQGVRVRGLYPCENVVSKCSSNAVTVRVTRDAKLSNSFHLDISPSTTLSLGKHQFVIPLQLWMEGTQQRASVELPVSVEVNGEYYLVPSLANWGALKIGKPSAELIQLRSRGDKEFAVTKIVCGSSNVKVVPLDSLPSSKHIFRVECCFGAPGGHIENVDFLVKRKGDQSNGRGELERITLKIKCQVFSE